MGELEVSMIPADVSIDVSIETSTDVPEEVPATPPASTSTDTPVPTDAPVATDAPATPPTLKRAVDSDGAAPKRKKVAPSSFTWNEVFTYTTEEEDDEDEGADPEVVRDRLMTDCILQAMMDGRLNVAVSEDICHKVLGLAKGDGLPRTLSPMIFASFGELYPILRAGLKGRKNASFFECEVKGKKERFYIDLVKEPKKPCMTVCFADER
jgi:hypothetical protein